MLNPRENLLRALRHDAPEWIPVFGRVDPYNQPNREGMSPELLARMKGLKWGDENVMNFSRHLGLDVIDWFTPPISSSYKQTTVKKKQMGPDRITVWHTPHGDLREVERTMRADGTTYRTEHLLKSVEDIAAFAAILDDETVELVPDGLARLADRRRMVANDGITVFPMPGTPYGMLVRVYAGLETTIDMYADAPEALRDLFAVMQRNYLRRFSLAASCDVEMLLAIDDTSTTTISPRMFEQFCVDYTDAVADAVHTEGTLYCHHSCGLIHDLLGLYRQTRMDAVHAYMVPPIGDVTIAEGRPLVGEKITIIPTMIQLFANMQDRQAAAASIKTMFADASPGSNIIFQVTADPGRTMDDTWFVVNECKKYQRMYQN